MGPKRKASNGSPGEPKSKSIKAMMSLSVMVELLNMLALGKSASKVARHSGINESTVRYIKKKKKK